MMLVSRTAVILTILIEGQLLLVMAMIAGAIFRRRAAVARISIGAFADPKLRAYVRCVAGHIMATAPRLGQHQAGRDKEDDEGIGDEPHGVILLLDPEGHKGFSKW